MILPNLLVNELKKAEFDIDSHGELPAFRRKQIHQLIEKLSSKEHKDAGYYRRAKLSIICAYFCLRNLDKYPDIKSEAQEILKKSVLALQSKFNMKDLEEINSKFYTKSVNLIDKDNPNFKAIYASFACVATANTVLYDNDFNVLGINEKEVDPSDWDASFYSSISHCGGAIWENTGNSKERKEFWIWYLDKAIPYAWDISTPLGPIVHPF